MFQSLKQNFQVLWKALTCIGLQIERRGSVEGLGQRQRPDWKRAGRVEGFSGLLILQSRKTGSISGVQGAWGGWRNSLGNSETSRFPTGRKLFESTGAGLWRTEKQAK